MTHAENEELRRLLRPVPGGPNDLNKYAFEIKRKRTVELDLDTPSSGMNRVDLKPGYTGFTVPATAQRYKR